MGAQVNKKHLFNPVYHRIVVNPQIVKKEPVIVSSAVKQVFWLIAWLFLNVLDFVITWYFLSNGGRELNPVLNNTSLGGMALLKLMVPALVIVVLYKARRPEYLKGLCLGMVVVVIWMLLWLIW